MIASWVEVEAVEEVVVVVHLLLPSLYWVVEEEAFHQVLVVDFDFVVVSSMQVVSLIDHVLVHHVRLHQNPHHHHCY